MMRPRLRIPINRPRLGVPAQVAQSPFAQQARMKHVVPTLDHIKKEEGIPGLMDPGTFQMAWEEYQTFILHNLNRVITETVHEFQDLKTIIIQTAREPIKAPVFNHASMAHNNHFFFLGMSPTETKMSPKLQADLEQSFGSIETLQKELIYTAAAMFGPGFVWLVKQDVPGNPGVFKVLTTYNAGSPYPEAHWRTQGMDTNTDVGNWDEDGLKAGKTYLERSALGAGQQTPESKKRLSLAPGGADLVPVLCLNTWEHVWLRQFGFQNGKKSGKWIFAENWWHRINWDRVEKLALPASKSMMS